MIPRLQPREAIRIALDSGITPRFRESLTAEEALEFAHIVINTAGSAYADDGLVHLAKALVAARDRADRLRMTDAQKDALRRFTSSASAESRHPMTVRVIAELLAAQEGV